MKEMFDTSDILNERYEWLNEAVRTITAAQEEGFEYHYAFNDEDYKEKVAAFGWQEGHRVVRVELKGE